MKNLINIVLFLMIYSVYGQTWDVKISGTVTDMESEKLIENIPVVLMENQDTIAIEMSGNQGEFLFEVKFSAEHEYSIFLNIPHQNLRQNWIRFHAKGDTIVVREYLFELSKLKLIHDRFDTGIYYEINEKEKYQNFDLDYFLKILNEYPQMCIRFVQTINPNEKKSVAKKREKAFLKLLKEKGINMNQINFSDEVFMLDITTAEDIRSRIEGVAYSMDGNCK